MVWESGRMKSQNQKPPEKPIVKGKEMGMLLGKLLLTESCFGSLSRQRARDACPDPEFPGEPMTPPPSLASWVLPPSSPSLSPLAGTMAVGVLGGCPVCCLPPPAPTGYLGGRVTPVMSALPAGALDRAPVPPQCGGHRPGASTQHWPLLPESLLRPWDHLQPSEGPRPPGAALCCRRSGTGRSVPHSPVTLRSTMRNGVHPRPGGPEV